MTAPTIRPCPTPGHAHVQYLEPERPEARYRVTSYASHEDVERGEPRTRTYHVALGHALQAAAEVPAPIVDVTFIR